LVSAARPAPRRPSRWPLLAIAGVVAIASTLAWRLGYFEAARRGAIITALGDISGSPAAAAIFMLAWVLAVLLCLPTTVLTVLGGALFGTAHGALCSWSAALIGTAAAHAVAHKLDTPAIRRRFGTHRLFGRLQARADVPFLIRMRVMPIAPFGVLDYVAGLAGVPMRPIMLATAIGVAPGILAYTFAGAQLRIGLNAPAGAGKQAFFIAGLISLGMVAIAVIPWVARRLSRLRVGTPHEQAGCAAAKATVALRRISHHRPRRPRAP
jgi:uncharacterized membrane protein YdjX (TVP38/TMEM64 family)